MKEANNSALAALWMLMPTMGGVLAFTAIGWYPYLLVSAMTGCIAWTMLEDRRSKKIYLTCVAAAGLTGMATHWLFLSPDGSLSDTGVLVALSAMIFLGFFAMKIYSIENGDEDAESSATADS